MEDRCHSIASKYLEPGIAYCSERGLELYRLYLLAYRARFELDQGRWTEAADSAAAVLRIPRTSTTPRIIALSVLALVRARRGDPEVWPLLDEAWALAEPTGELPRLGPVAAARAEAAWLDGDRHAIGEATEGALQLACERQSPWLVGELAAWRRRAGLDEDTPSHMAEPYALQLAGDWARAAELWQSLGCPYEAALALADADEEEPLRRALAELQAVDARPAAALVARRLRKRGARGLPRGPRPATRQNPAGLTPRELRGAWAGRGRAAEWRDCRAARALGADRRPPCCRDPPQAGRSHPRPRRAQPLLGSGCSTKIRSATRQRG